MPAALRVKLALSEDKQLLEISQNNQSPNRTKVRAESLRLSNHGWKVDKGTSKKSNFLKMSNERSILSALFFFSKSN
jgi:hypothetical protein